MEMGSTADKVSGVANEAVGKIKESTGKVTGSDKLEAEGLAQQAKGKAEKLAGDAKQAVKDATNKVQKTLIDRLRSYWRRHQDVLWSSARAPRFRYSATEVMQRHLEGLEPNIAKLIREGHYPFHFPGLHFTRESADMLEPERPKVDRSILEFV
jgi:uncharacterized protein YjbJ (UPF0337 family)